MPLPFQVAKIEGFASILRPTTCATPLCSESALMALDWMMSRHGYDLCVEVVF